jgi:hypothetical protein
MESAFTWDHRPKEQDVRRMKIKVGSHVLIRDDKGDFTIPGIVTERTPRSRSVEVSHKWNGKTEIGKFGVYDLQIVG